MFGESARIDDDYQVVGQTIKGAADILEKISDLPTRADDAPTQTVVVDKCGLTTADGAADIEVAGEGAAAALEREEEETANAVREALQSTKQEKKKSEATAKRKKALDAGLLGDSDSDSSDDDGDDDDN